MASPDQDAPGDESLLTVANAFGANLLIAVAKSVVAVTALQPQTLPGWYRMDG